MSINSVGQAQSRYDSAQINLTFIKNLYVPGASDANQLQQAQSEFNAASKALDAAKKTAQLMNSSPLSTGAMGAASAGFDGQSGTNFSAGPMNVAQAQANLLITQKQQKVNLLTIKVNDLIIKEEMIHSDYDAFNKPEAKKARMAIALPSYPTARQKDQAIDDDNAAIIGKYNALGAIQNEAYAANSELQIAKAELQLAQAVYRDAK